MVSGAVPDFKAFRGIGGLVVTTNPSLGTVTIDGSSLSGSTNGIPIQNGNGNNTTITNETVRLQSKILGNLFIGSNSWLTGTIIFPGLAQVLINGDTGISNNGDYYSLGNIITTAGSFRQGQVTMQPNIFYDETYLGAIKLIGGQGGNKLLRTDGNTNVVAVTMAGGAVFDGTNLYSTTRFDGVGNNVFYDDFNGGIVEGINISNRVAYGDVNYRISSTTAGYGLVMTNGQLRLTNNMAQTAFYLAVTNTYFNSASNWTRFGCAFTPHQHAVNTVGQTVVSMILAPSAYITQWSGVTNVLHMYYTPAAGYIDIEQGVGFRSLAHLQVYASGSRSDELMFWETELVGRSIITHFNGVTFVIDDDFIASLTQSTNRNVIYELNGAGTNQWDAAFDAVWAGYARDSYTATSLSNATAVSGSTYSVIGTRAGASLPVKTLTISGAGVSVTDTPTNIAMSISGGGGGGGGPGTLPMNANQFNTNDPVSIAKGALMTNISVRGITSPDLTASRVKMINSAGVETNVTSASASTDYVHADGSVGTPTATAAGGSSAIQFAEGTAIDGTNGATHKLVYNRSNDFINLFGSLPYIMVQDNSVNVSNKITTSGIDIMGTVQPVVFKRNGAALWEIDGYSNSYRPTTNVTQDIGLEDSGTANQTNRVRTIFTRDLNVSNIIVKANSMPFNNVDTWTATGTIASHWTNILTGGGTSNINVAAIQDGQKMSIWVLPTNGLTVALQLDGAAAPAAMYYAHSADAIRTNGWNEIVVERRGTITNIFVRGPSFTLISAGPVSLDTNFVNLTVAVRIDNALSNMVGTVANNVTNESSTQLQINNGTLSLSPSILSNLVNSGIDFPTTGIESNVFRLLVGQIEVSTNAFIASATVTNNIARIVKTVAGVGGANTNFTFQADSGVVYVDGGTTNINIVAIMSAFSAGIEYRLRIFATNRTATARTLSLGATTNNWINAQLYTGGDPPPYTITNSQALQLTIAIKDTNCTVSAVHTALPTQ